MIVITQNKLVKGLAIVSIGASLIGCETKAGTGALVGGAGGALLGGAIGSTSHARAGEGALIGGAVGALGGALVGNGMDQADKKKEDRYAERDYDRRHNTTLADPVSKYDIISWTEKGVKDDVIIDRVERSRTVFRLTAADENELRDRGVSPMVITAMRDTARR